MFSRLKYFFIIIILITITACSKQSQLEQARESIAEVISKSDGKIGAAVIDLETGDTLTFNNNSCYPMQSVFKFPLALAILDQVDKGKLSTEQTIHVSERELLPNTWSPLREKYKNGADIALGEILEYTVAQSDNNGCDILFNIAGGTDRVDKFIKRLGIDGISIVADEAQMHSDWNIQYKNCAHPLAMTKLLKLFNNEKVLSRASTDLLFQIMGMNVFGLKRIGGNLPGEAKVEHKTGTSGTNDEGLTPATNDAGIVSLPNGKHYAITVFVSDSNADKEIRDKVIADISKAVWDVLIKY